MADEKLSLHNRIEEITCDALENTTFMDVDVIEDERDEFWYEDKLHSFISVKSPVKGYISLIMPAQLVDNISEIILAGLENVSTQKLRKDTLSELVNIVAGRIMSDLKPNGLSFSIGLPKVIRYNNAQTNYKTLVHFFEMNDYEFAVKIIGSNLLDYFSLTEKNCS